MKPLLKKSLESLNQSYITRNLKEPYFDPNWHFHPHYQLFTVIEGTGTRLIGDDIRHFEAGDTVFLAPNMPHLWRSDRAYFERDSGLQTQGIVVYFTEDFLGKDFFEKPEMYAIKNLFASSERGLDLTHSYDLKATLVEDLMELNALNGFEGILKLLSILQKLSTCTDYQFIASVNYENTHKISETERMRQVHEYVLKHYKEKISLSEVATLANMSEAAFCRYFKTRTNKTFSDFVREIRIGHACKLLLAGKMSIAQVSYESGFNTVSNFNSQFKAMKGQSPKQYQKMYVGE
ncbi:MAG: AraC family transcriptional regulator [Haliscomenobacter sp.]|uniref:AraC family transcriptional regulator n=1 Tax=Haliscomenobacter sp. TaxID=2717303 RepID=UPI0029B34710|nr:AraC family transcriptional regulator [Haliscomenobacter sp.]MDX2069008.1 AraC family transcriptional regulator [Haliscomenobacter sp.]